MDNNGRTSLEEKRKALQLKLKIDNEIKSDIVYHWLDYYKEMLEFGMQVEIIYLQQCSKELLGLYRSRIAALNNDLLDPDKVIEKENPWISRIFNRFPSISDFKYEIEAPMLENTGSVSEMLQLSAQALQINPTDIIFLSNDFSPVVKLKWEELLKNADPLFNDGGITTLIFTDPNFNWIIFRSIEEQWNYDKW